MEALNAIDNHYGCKMVISLELKQIPEISRYLFEIHCVDTGFELFRIVANQLSIIFMVSNNV